MTRCAFAVPGLTTNLTRRPVLVTGPDNFFNTQPTARHTRAPLSSARDLQRSTLRGSGGRMSYGGQHHGPI